MMLPLPSQRMALRAVLVGSWRPLAAPTSVKLMPSVVVATRIVMTSLFGLLCLPVTILVSAQLGVFGQLVGRNRRDAELLLDIDDRRQAGDPQGAEDGVRALEAGRRLRIASSVG